MTSLNTIREDEEEKKEEITEEEQKELIIKSLEKQGLEDIKLERKLDYSKMNYKEKYYHKTLKENIEGVGFTIKRLKDKIKVCEFELEIISKLNRDPVMTAMKNKIYSNMNKDKAELSLYNKWLSGYKRIRKYLKNQYEKNTD